MSTESGSTKGVQKKPKHHRRKRPSKQPEGDVADTTAKQGARRRKHRRPTSRQSGVASADAEPPAASGAASEYREPEDELRDQQLQRGLRASAPQTEAPTAAANSGVQTSRGRKKKKKRKSRVKSGGGSGRQSEKTMMSPRESDYENVGTEKQLEGNGQSRQKHRERKKKPKKSVAEATAEAASGATPETRAETGAETTAGPSTRASVVAFEVVPAETATDAPLEASAENAEGSMAEPLADMHDAFAAAAAVSVVSAAAPVVSPAPTMNLPGQSASAASALRTCSAVLRLICAATVGLLVVGSFVVAIVHTGPVKTPRCGTEGCIYHAYRLAEAMDLAANPCENFYAYACGNWEAFQEGAANQAEDAAMSLAADVLDSMARPLPSNRLVGTLVRACVANKAGPSGSARGFIDFAKALGLPMDKADAFDGHPVALLVILSARWNVDLLFSLQVVADKRRNLTPFVLLTSPKKQRLPEVQDAAGRYAERHLRDHLEAFADTDPQRLREVQRELLEASSFEFEQQETLHIADIGMTNFSAKEWLSLLDDHYNPEFVFEEHSTIVLENEGLLRRLDDVLRKHTRREVVATVCWMFVHEYLWLLTDLGFGSVNDTARGSTTGEDDASLLRRHRPAECLHYVDTFLGIISGANLVKDVFSTSVRTQIDHLFETIDTSLVEAVQSSHWIDAKTKKNIVSKVRDVARDVWPTDTLYNTDELLTLYRDMSLTNRDVTVNFVSATRKARSLLGSELYSDLFFRTLATTPFGMTGYLYHANSVLVSASALGAPFFYPDAPSAVNYGGLGALYASQLVRLLDKSGVALVSNRTRGPLWEAGSRAQYYQKANCVMEHRATAGRIEMFPSVPALEVAYEASRHQRDFYAPAVGGTGLDATSGPRLFFLSYCHALCSANGSHASNLCNLPLRNFAPFASAFNCPLGFATRTERCTFFSE